MARTTKDRMITYPQRFWEVIEAAVSGKDCEWKFNVMNAAVNTRHRFYNFRKDAILEGIPGAEKLGNMMLTIHPDPGAGVVLRFNNLQTIYECSAATGTAPHIPVSGQPLPTIMSVGQLQRSGLSHSYQGLDDFDTLIENMYGVKKPPEDRRMESKPSNVIPLECEHEWTPYGYCKKCQMEKK